MTAKLPIASLSNEKAEPLTHKSKGEKLFDRAVYGGIAGAATFVLTLWLSGKVLIAKDVEELAKVGKIEKKIRDLLETHKENKALTQAVKTTVLMQGGNLMIAPVALAEHYKEAIVTKINDRLGEKTDVSAIEQKPKQTISSLIEGRMLAWLAVFSALFSADKFLPETMDTYQREFGTRITEDLLKQPLLTAKNIMVDGISKPLETKTFQYSKVAALDMLATVAAATLLYFGGHFFARKHEEKKAQLPAKMNHHALLNDEELALTTVTEMNAPKMMVHGVKTHEGPLQLMTPELSVN